MLGSSWVLGILVALATWGLRFIPPLAGLEWSWNAALYMGLHRGIAFGSDIVFTFGPLGFLNRPFMWYGTMSAIAFVYQAALIVLLSVSLVWALRRSFNAIVAVIVAYFAVLASLSTDLAPVLAAIWCLIALAPESPAFVTRIVLYGGAVLGAVQTLIVLRSGPVIWAMAVIVLLAREGRRRTLPVFAGCAAGTFLVLWFALGQGLSALGDYVSNGLQIVSGYSEAMGGQCAGCWGVDPSSSSSYLPAILVLGAALIAVAALTSAPGRRLAGAAVMALIAFVAYKEAVVRADFGHTPTFFAMAVGVGAGLAFGRRRVLGLAAVAGLAVLSIASQPVAVTLNPFSHLDTARAQFSLLFHPGRRDAITAADRRALLATYGLDAETLALLRGHTVHVDPWNTAVVWAYGLNWRSPPVFQDYSAYTAPLDRLNADFLRSSRGPERILRENITAKGGDVDGRWLGWDPPEQWRAVLCDYAPLRTTPSWQVLGRIPARCGTPVRIGSATARTGQAVPVPTARSGGVVYAVVHGADVSGLEKLRTLLYRARFRDAVVNGTSTYRLVPGTAGDGLLMAAAHGVDYPAPYALTPAARTIAFTGTGADLRIDFFWMPVRPAPGGRA